ncbi:hypothetical protein GOODEAATRI_007847, partial [Goodea atripinnis]
AGIAVGFYGNGETCDGVNRVTYSLRHANRTITGVQKLVYDSTSSLNQTVDNNLQQLEGQYAQHADYLSIIQKLQGQLDELVRQMVEIPFWDNNLISLEDLSTSIELYDWYRVCLFGVVALLISWVSLGLELAVSVGSLEEIQGILNTTEISLHQLTALVDCRSLHMDYVQGMTGLCYDGLEGLIYLLLFSFVTALMFSSIVCSVPHTWRGKR